MSSAAKAKANLYPARYSDAVGLDRQPPTGQRSGNVMMKISYHRPLVGQRG